MANNQTKRIVLKFYRQVYVHTENDDSLQTTKMQSGMFLFITYKENEKNLEKMKILNLVNRIEFWKMCQRVVVLCKFDTEDVFLQMIQQKILNISENSSWFGTQEH